MVIIPTPATAMSALALLHRPRVVDSHRSWRCNKKKSNSELEEESNNKELEEKNQKRVN